MSLQTTCAKCTIWKLTMHHCSSNHYYHLQSQAACWVTQVDSGLVMNQALVQTGSCKCPD